MDDVLNKRESNPEPVSMPLRVLFQDTTERNFITAGRAAQEFLLKPSQLEGLKKYIRRSPFESEVTITVYTVKDVKERAIEVWGSLENMEKEKANRENYQRIIAQSNYEAKKTLREARRESEGSKIEGVKRKVCTKECNLVVIAITIDLINVIFKLVTYFLTNSESLLAETVHSTADTLNQSILLFGSFQMSQKANPRHPYGYSATMYVASLISGVGIFCLGSAISIFNGASSLFDESPDLKFEEAKLSFIVLGFSFLTESISFSFSLAAAIKTAKQNKLTFFSYVFRSNDPGVVAIFMEDFTAILGDIVAASCIGLSLHYTSPIPDSIGSIVIGFLLGGVALFLIITNSMALVGRSIRMDRLEKINKVVESDVMVRALYDVKGIDMGNNLVRYKAELDFDGAELTRLYLDRNNLNALLAEVKSIQNIDDLERFMLTHGENIVDLLGGEIDRIENKVRNKFPEVRHVDLELV